MTNCVCVCFAYRRVYILNFLFCFADLRVVLINFFQRNVLIKLCKIGNSFSFCRFCSLNIKIFLSSSESTFKSADRCFFFCMLS
ncbi:hypothetical protein PUN28_004616 [Cardiocondyla obscurior]|uniref:Secreted protein n=1 Tax=Cardiocondyla obscurior TaxID=286306 RepID=A0AAW2GGE3_9HYME